MGARSPRISLPTLALAALLAVLAFGRRAHAEEPQGKKVFVEQECNGCHTIQGQGIERVEVEGDDEADEEKGDREPPDLSTIGDEKDKVWIAKYLIKRETLKDEKHPKRFRGSKEELAAVAEWLGGLKSGASE